RAARRDGAAVHGRARDVVADDLLERGTGMRDEARQLLERCRTRRQLGRVVVAARAHGIDVTVASAVCLTTPEVRPRIAELGELALLAFQAGGVDRSAVDAGRRAGLEPVDRQA